jgi:hypothetical protein
LNVLSCKAEIVNLFAILELKIEVLCKVRAVVVIINVTDTLVEKLPVNFVLPKATQVLDYKVRNSLLRLGRI